MSQSRAQGAVTRRGALKLIGMSAGATLALPILPQTLIGSPTDNHRDDELTLALVRTDSGIIAGGADDFERGLRLALEAEAAIAGRAPARLVVRTIAPGIASARRAVAKLGADRRIDAVVGLVAAGVTGWLRPLVEEAGLPFIEAGFGENAPRIAGDSPLIVRSTLSYWQASWALGAHSARTLGRRSLVVTTMLDSGYDMLRAWRAGVSGAGGSVDVHLIDADTATAGLDRSLASAASRADHIHLLVRPDALDDARSALRRGGVAGRLPVVASAITPCGAADAGCSTWFAGLDNRRNAAFVAAWSGAHGSQPTAAAALGHETGRLVAEAAATSGRTRRALADALASASWRGTRGRVDVVAGANSVSAPLYLRAHSTTPVSLPSGSAPDVTDARTTELRRGAYSGWSHSYLG